MPVADSHPIERELKEKAYDLPPIQDKLKRLPRLETGLPARYAEFWLNDPSILIRRDKWLELLPVETLNFASKLNAVTRLILCLAIIGFFLTWQWRIIISAIVSILMIIGLYLYKKKKFLEHRQKKNRGNSTGGRAVEGFTNNEKLYSFVKDNFSEPTDLNPMMNPLISDIVYNPKRKQAAPAFNRNVVEKINDNTLGFIEKNLDDKLFHDLGDQITFETSMRNFYTMPSTTIPNNQSQFAQYCYGNMPSCKEGNAFQCAKNVINGRQVVY